MLSVIKTALITIIISFISGVLLDRYKNTAPKLICNMKKLSNKGVKNSSIDTYIFTVKNISKKTIHNLNINLQSTGSNLKIDNAQINKGIKFEVENEDNNYNVNIPFLSKDDVFSVKLFLGKGKDEKNKPIAHLRSPENFKRINSNGSKESLNILSNIKCIFLDKRVIAIAVVIFLVFGGISLAKNLNSKAVGAGSSSNEKSEDASSGNSDASKKAVNNNEKDTSKSKPTDSSTKQNSNNNSNKAKSSESSKSSIDSTKEKGTNKDASTESSNKEEKDSKVDNTNTNTESKNNENKEEKKTSSADSGVKQSGDNSNATNKAETK